MYKKTIVAFLFICLHTFSYSQTLHAVMFVNEKEQGREVDRCADMRNMYRFWGNVAEAIGYTYAPVKCTPATFSAYQVDRAIRGLDVRTNDIVVFYYSGHGYNDESDIWPSLSLSDRNYRQIDIMKRLKNVSSSAKLILCIADCCNKQANSSYDLTVSYDAFDDGEAMRKLFLGYKGKKSIMLSASKQGQFSWSDLRNGAFYGISFRKVLSSLSVSEATWDIALDKVSRQTYRYTDGQQMPQFNITQSGDPFEE